MFIQMFCFFATLFNGAFTFPTELPRCNCIRLKECETFTQLLVPQNSHENDMSFRIAQEAECGYISTDTMVCCPAANTPMWPDLRNSNSNQRNSSDVWIWPSFAHSHEHAVNLDSTSTRIGKTATNIPDFEKRNFLESDIFDFKDPKTQRNFPHSFYEEISNMNWKSNDFAHYDENPLLQQFPHTHTNSGESGEEFSDYEHYTTPHTPGSGRPFDRPIVYPNDRRLNRPIIFPTLPAPKSNKKIKNMVEVRPTVHDMSFAQPTITTRCGIADFNVRNTSEQHYPWLVRIAYLNTTSNRISYRCSGSLISQFHVLTVAHCVKNLINDLELSHLRVGSSEQAGARTFQISSVIVHPNYDQPRYANDIAILKILRVPESDMDFMPICLPPNLSARDMNQFIGSTGIALAWSTDGAADTANPRIKFIRLPILNNTDCAITYAKFSENQENPIVITPSEMCAQGSPMNDVCRGDSGGPFMDDGTSGLIKSDGRYTLLGIVAFGPRMCGVSNIPGGYTRVSAFVDWIAANLS